MPITYRLFTIVDFDEALHLWQNTPGIGLSASDSREKTGDYLERNPGLSFVAEFNDHIIGTILAGHDGRRGYLGHLAVHIDFRHRGIGTYLIKKCMASLGEAGIDKCHIMVFADNIEGQLFWESGGWIKRNDIALYSHDICNTDTDITTC